ncbi:hypothetical protein ABIB42_004390 [Massilia sp. UYP32]|jgi:hypothetical protein|uniref:Uncharacterized protein n=1 Tax=Massilia timonae CCUG 45783 TaxID=883126 RepID=K9E0V6_9BURK|nr:hypothetical protein [Massilia timonae]EKU84517.1 hypothetical protein HMPREF9710_00249 [Massilia timonae CCUG 45783]HAK90827.1 hypothetical protein [Massilia timonae]
MHAAPHAVHRLTRVPPYAPIHAHRAPDPAPIEEPMPEPFDTPHPHHQPVHLPHDEEPVPDPKPS